jgi:chitin disaccharide deacetylase
MTGGAATAERRLIVNADDLGLSVGVNRGILEAHAAGTVTSTSLLVNTPGFVDAVTRLRLAPGLAVGLHFNLTAGKPLSPIGTVSTLCDADTGLFCPLARLVRRALTGRIAPEHVRLECEAQLARLRETGVRPTHLDAHRHVHLLPGVFPAVVAVAQRARLPLRMPREPLRRGAFAVRRVPLMMGVALASILPRGLEMSVRADHFRGMGLLGAVDFERRLIAVLDQLEPGTTELMVHPGHADRELARWDSYTKERERELAALLSGAVRQRLRRGDIALSP